MQAFLYWFLPRLAWLYLHFCGFTSRITGIHNTERKSRRFIGAKNIFAFWHGRQVFLSYAYGPFPNLSILVSQSKDGEYIARVMKLFGMGSIRGSSSRGSLRALVEMSRHLRNGKSVGISPDGPRGPQRTVAHGILYLARKEQVRIFPITWSARKKLIFRGWDEFWVPLPFNRYILNMGEPMEVPEGSDMEAKARELAQRLDATTAEADRVAAIRNTWAETFFFFAYDFVFLSASPLILLALAFAYPKTFFSSLSDGLGERFGNSNPDPDLVDKRPLWIHAASLGECRAALPLVKAVRQKFPNLPIVFTSTTPAGVSEARKLALGDVVVYAPLDLSLAAHRFVKSYQPRVLLLLESEIWPNWLRIAQESGMRVGIANGRVSSRSAERYAKFPWLARMLTKRIDFLCAREAADLERFEKMGLAAGKAQVSGNLKYDLLPWELNGKGPASGDGWSYSGGPLLVAGSVRKGEDEIALQTFAQLKEKHPTLKLLLAPRHLENLPELESAIGSLGLKSARRSQAESRSGWDVLIWDTFGDLWQAYRSATIVYVGGSLVPKGGQNPIEPAWFAKPIVFGPHMENFAEPARLLLAAKAAAQVSNARSLETQLSAWLSDPAQRDIYGKNAKSAVSQLLGQATDRTLATLAAYLQ